MRRHRLTELLARSNLADADIEREKIRAARDSGNFANATQALRSLVPGVTGMIGDAQKTSAADAQARAARNDALAEKQRLEAREDSALKAKNEREDELSADKAALAATSAAEARAREDVASKTAREDAMDKEAARDNLAGFAQQDARHNNDEKNAIEREKIAAKGKASGSTKPAPPPKGPPAATKNKIAGYDTQIAQLDDLLKRKDSVNLGPVDTKINDAAQAVGLDDPVTTKYKADVSNVISQIISDLSGANVPAGEWQRLKNGLPQPNDQDSAFKAKLESKLEQLRAARKYLGDAYAAPAAPSQKPLETMSGEDLAALSDEELRALAGGE